MLLLACLYSGVVALELVRVNSLSLMLYAPYLVWLMYATYVTRVLWRLSVTPMPVPAM